MVKTISANDLKKGLEQGEVLLIDVREPGEYKTECIDGSCLIPLSEVSLQKLPYKTGTIVINCRSGKRSEEACKKLLAENPNIEVYSLSGGIVAWKEAGFAIKRFGAKVLPLDRQTQFASGLLAFSGVVLGTIVNRWFYALAGFVGLGLMFAGITGWCGMAKLLAKMPWNK